MTLSGQRLAWAVLLLCVIAIAVWTFLPQAPRKSPIEADPVVSVPQAAPKVIGRDAITPPPTFAPPADTPSVAPDQVLVRFAPGVSPQQVESIANTIGAVQKQSYRSPGLFMFALPETVTAEQARTHFERYDEVELVEEDIIYTLDDVPNDPDFSLHWGLHNTGQDGGVEDIDINAPEAWNEITDSGPYVVAVIDSGADLTHADLVDTLWINPFEIPGNGVDDDGNGHVDDMHGIDQIEFDGEPNDELGHGSHVAGTIGAAGNNGIGGSGVFWNSQLLHCKVFSEFGWTTLSRILTCMDYVVWAFDEGINVVAVNASWSGGYSQLLQDAVVEFDTRDILIVAAAGNDAENIDGGGWYPAAYPYDNVIAVAAIDRRGDIAPWSNVGAVNVDIAAPGVDIWSTDYRGGWRYASGTSMAAPHVAGVVALVKAASPPLTMTEVRTHVLSSGVADSRYDSLVASGSRLRIELPFVDSDGDGMTDRWEKRFGLNPLDPSDGALDPDNDGLTNLEEFQATTHPNKDDTDGDGISDFDELNVYGSDPKFADSDADGLDDFQETQIYGTDPNAADTDGDGWSDIDEIDVSGTDPLNADMDGDGLLDGWELDNGYDPLSPGEANLDLDNDGLTSLEEQAVSTDPNDFDTDDDSAGDGQEVNSDLTNPLDRDTDNDDNDDGWESNFGLDPLRHADGLEDTDGDGYTNRAEFRGGSDPTVRSSVPLPLPWNGRQADSRHTGYVPVHTSAADFHQRWIGQLPLNGREQTPVVGRHSITGAGRGDGNTILAECDTRNGNFLRTHAVPAGYGPNDLQMTLGNFYAITNDSSIGSSVVFGINAATGVDVFPPIDLGPSSSPALTAYGEKLYVKGNAELIEFDAATGAEQWRTPIPGVAPSSFSPPAVNDIYVATISQSALQIYDRATGQHLHSVDLETCTQNDDQILFDESHRALVNCFTRLTAIDMQAGTANWSISTLRDTWMAMDPEFVYVTSYLGLHVLDRITGEHQWTWFSDDKTTPSGNLIVTLDHAIITNSFVTMAIDLETHDVAWQIDLGGYTYMNRDGALFVDPAWSGPIVAIDTSGDLDSDGMSDWWEKYFGFDIANAADGAGDRDGDGLDNASEFTNGSDPDVQDSDDDGLTDGDEVGTYRTSPTDSDSDNDGVNDGDEVLVHGTDPSNTDTDGDGFSDGEEVGRNSDPADAASQPMLPEDYFESFENGVPAGWTISPDGQVSFNVTTDLSTDGSASLRSQPRVHQLDYASIEFTENFRAGDLYFDADISTGAEFGRLQVYVDDRLVGEKRDTGWSQMSVYVPHGRHSIEFRFRDIGVRESLATIDNLRYVRPRPYGSNIDNTLALANSMLYEIRPDGSLARAPIWIPGSDSHEDLFMGPDHRVVISSNADSIVYDPVLETFAPLDTPDLVPLSSSFVRAVVATDDGYVVAGRTENAPLYQFNRNGELRDTVFNGTASTDLEVGQDGWLYGLRSHQGEIYRFDPQTLARLDTVHLEIRATNGIAIDSLGHFYSASRENPAGSQVRIEVYDPAGTLLTTHELETTASLMDPELTDNGYLLFGGGAGEVHRLRKDLRASQRFELDLLGGSGWIWVASVPRDGPDNDLDGMPDWWERATGLDHRDPTDASFDPDSDGLTNLEEFNVNADPLVADTDGDGLDDGAEVSVHLTDPTVADTDLDGLTDGEEVNLHNTDPANEDSDGDNLNDGDEILIVDSDPLLDDTDGDGISDHVEFRHRMAVDDASDGSADFDGDGISNVEEIQRGTGMRNRDTDYDGLTDSTEIHVSLTNPLVFDTDGDRMPDGWEFRNGLDPNIADASLDPDGDGFRNDIEFHALSHPSSAVSVPTHTQWANDQGDVKHRGFAPVRLDFANFVDLWQTDPSAETTEPLSQASISENFVFTTTIDRIKHDYILLALERETGALAWEHKFVGYGFASPPSNDGVSTFVQTGNHSDSYIYSFEQATGNINYQVPYSNQIIQSRAPLHRDGSLYLQSGHFGGIARHDAATGAELWQMNHDSGDGHSLTVIDNEVFSYSMKQGLLRINETTTGDRKYSIRDETFAWSGYTTYSSIVQGNYTNLMMLYGSGLVSFDLRERKPLWRNPVNSPWHVGMALGPGVAYVVEPRALVAIDERSGQELWRWQTARFIQTDPVVTIDHVLIGTDVATFAIDIQTGQPAWSYPFGGRASISDTLDLFIAGYSGEMAAIQTQRDADGDNIPDDWELRFAHNPNNPADAATDADGDGLTQLEEYLARTNPTLADTDSDMLDDLAEIRTHHSDPLQSDSDGDGLSDSDEVLTYQTRPDHVDSDDDGLTDDHEVNDLGTNPALTDSDNDGWADNIEIRLGSDPTSFGSIPPVVTEFFESFESGNLPLQFENGSNDSHWWTVDDWNTTDGHRVARPVWVETLAPAEMTWEDNFADGILIFDFFSRNTFCCDELEVFVDGQRVLHANQLTEWKTMSINIPAGHRRVSWRFTRQVGNDINQLQTFIDSIQFMAIDADNDGMPADWELLHRLDPNDPSDAGDDPDQDGLTNLEEYQSGTLPFNSDTDGDGMPDGWELDNNLDPTSNSDANSDPDSDSLSNINEFRAGTSPNNRDTDGDQMPDGWEVTYGLNPLRANGSEDADGDGATNLSEYEHGTDPTNAASTPPNSGGGGGSGGGSGGGGSGGGGGAVGFEFLWFLLGICVLRRFSDGVFRSRGIHVPANRRGVTCPRSLVEVES